MILRPHVVALLVAAPAAALPPIAVAADPPVFRTPSHNIACAVSRSALRCDMRLLGNPAARKPPSCRFDYGHAFGVTRQGARGRRLCVSDAIDVRRAATVPYGRTWRRAGFSCRVRTTGLRCVNPRGHGFALRKGRQRLF
jgi:hypothetical protein